MPTNESSPADRDDGTGGGSPDEAGSSRHRLRRALVTAGLAVGVLAAATAGALLLIGGGSGVEARQRALEAERDALRGYLRAGDAPERPIVEFADLLVRIRRGLVEELVEAALPIERELDGRYRVRVDSAVVTLRPGIALVRLVGRAALLERPDVFADVTLLGGFEVFVPDTVAADLRGRVSIFGVDTRDVGLGPLTPPAERVVNGLARLRVSELDRLLGEIQLPVRFDETVALPRVEESEITIPGAAFAVGFRLASVRVLEPGIFVSLAVERESRPGPARPDPDTVPAPGSDTTAAPRSDVALGRGSGATPRPGEVP